MLWLVGVAVVLTFIIKSLASYGQDVLLAYVGQHCDRGPAEHAVRPADAPGRGALPIPPFRHARLAFHLRHQRDAGRRLERAGRHRPGQLVGHSSWLRSCSARIGSLSLVTLVVAPLTAIPIDRLARRLRQVSTGIQTEMGLLTTSLSQSFQGIRVIKSFGMEEAEAARTQGVVRRLYKLNFRAARVGAAVQPIIDAFGGLRGGGGDRLWREPRDRRHDQRRRLLLVHRRRAARLSAAACAGQGDAQPAGRDGRGRPGLRAHRPRGGDRRPSRCREPRPHPLGDPLRRGGVRLRARGAGAEPAELHLPNPARSRRWSGPPAPARARS